MNIKAPLAIVACLFAFSANAQSGNSYSNSADDYVEARYGTHTPDAVYDTQISKDKQVLTDVDVGKPGPEHSYHRFQKFMGGHD